MVLRTGFLCRSGYEWTQHVPIGQRAGLTDAEVAAIKLGADGPNWSAADRALLRATDDLHAGQFITDATWQALAAHFQPRQCMDVVFTVGQYTQVSMILNSFGVQLDEGQVLDPDLIIRARDAPTSRGLQGLGRGLVEAAEKGLEIDVSHGRNPETG